jgi:Ankyrin repeats (3 copies)/Ankyrin repeats (many copies)
MTRALNVEFQSCRGAVNFCLQPITHQRPKAPARRPIGRRNAAFQPSQPTKGLAALHSAQADRGGRQTEIKQGRRGGPCEAQSTQAPAVTRIDSGNMHLLGGLLMSTYAKRKPRQRAIADRASSMALRHAAFRGQTEQIIELIAADADVNEPDSDGDTPLMLAAARGHTSIIALLLRNGANVDAHNDNGQTALHQATHGGHTETAQALLAAGCQVDARDNGGSTALMHAAFGGHADIAVALLAAGADARLRNHGGYRPADLAARSGLDLNGRLSRLGPH